MMAMATPQRNPPPHTMQTSLPATAGPSAVAGMDDDDNDEADNIFRDMSFEEVLEDLNARFLANLPEEEMTLVRLYWQAEQAHWFYEDYLRPLNPLLPSLSQRQFTHLIIASSPLYDGADIDYDAVWEEYCAYKKMVPCCGGILINATHDKVLMVRGWKTNAGWCFPRGKINSEESEVACAIREVEEETGFDLTGRINPNDFVKTQINAQEVTMFIVKDIDESTVFETQTRKEIGAIEWVPFFDLPTWANKKGPKRTPGQSQKKFYNVTPFVGPLKKWLQKQGINPYPKRRGEAVPATRQRELKPFAFDDEPSQPPVIKHVSHAGHQHPTTALDQLFSKFIQKDDNVTALESDNARTLDQLFGGLMNPDPATKPNEASKVQGSQSTQATQASEDDALARLLSGLTTAPAPAPAPGPSSAPAPHVSLPPPDSKQSKLLAVLSTSKNAAPPGTPPQANRSNHQTNLLSMLSPPKPSSTALAPHGANPAPHPAPSLSAPAPPMDDNERHNRQQALLQSLFMGGQSVPSTPPGLHLRPQAGASPASGMISPMPQMPPSQAGWQPPSPSNLRFQNASPTRGPPYTPPQLDRSEAGSQYYSPRPMPPHLSPQQMPRPPQPQFSSPPQPNFNQTPPRPPVNNHQRALLGTLFNNNRPPMQPSFNGPGMSNNHPMPMPNGPPNGLPPNNHPGPNMYSNPGFPQFPNMPRDQFYNGPPPFPMNPSRGGYMPPPGMLGARPPPMSGPGGPPPHPPAPQQQQQQQKPQPPASVSPAMPSHPAPQPQPLAPGSAVHQPVPRPPVGGGLLGLINGTSG